MARVPVFSNRSNIKDLTYCEIAYFPWITSKRHVKTIGAYQLLFIRWLAVVFRRQAEFGSVYYRYSPYAWRAYQAVTLRVMLAEQPCLLLEQIVPGDSA